MGRLGGGAGWPSGRCRAEPVGGGGVGLSTAWRLRLSLGWGGIEV